MVYLLNLSQEDYLSSNIPNRSEIEAAVTMDGKFSSSIIPYSIEHEKAVASGKTKEKSEVDRIIKAGYE